MFEGLETGKLDDNGVKIKCGDRVSFYQFKEGYVQTTAEDGYGGRIRISPSAQRAVPDKNQTTMGTVVYKASITGFEVEFDNYLMNSGRKSQSLYMLGKSMPNKKDRLFIVP